MLSTAGKPPNLRKARKRDAIADAIARRADEIERDPKRERQAMLRFLAYLKPSAHYFVIASLCGVTIYLVPNLIPTAVGYVLDHILGTGGSASASPAKANALFRMLDFYIAHTVGSGASKAARIQVLLGSLLVFLPFWGILVFFRAYFAGIGGQRVIFKLRNDLYEHIQSLSLSYFQRERSGSIVSRLTSDVALAQNFIGNACTNLWMDSLSILILGGFLLTLDRKLALTAFAVLPLWILSVRLFGQQIRKASHAVQEGLSEMSGQVQEKMSGVTVVQAFAREKREVRLFHRLHRSLLVRQVTAVRLASFNMAMSNLLTTIAPVIVVWVGALEVLHGKLTPGTLLMFWAFLGTFYGPLQRITDLAAVISNASAAIERIFQIFDICPEVKEKENAITLPGRIHGKVEFDHVWFGYDENPILKDISLTIQPGEVVAFVGPSGAGKSTLIQLVPRLYDVTKGAIRVDGRDIRDFKKSWFRSFIGMVLQDNILFTGSIRDNILYGRPDADDDAVVEAAIAGNAHDFIESQADGYDTEIGERGTKLSGGQKQRIAITRAFLRDPRILILDEATSALDSESERLIQAALNRLMIGRTTLIIAHRLSTILHADKIVVMDKGRIVEQGKHADLLANGGLYYELYKAQFEHALSVHDAAKEILNEESDSSDPYAEHVR
ncbi:SAV1866 family putative multidrug efflux ABC transporter [Capsulimonas corticalis]|uniref:SAV1866 family putative multidrug efflux ABC transporter n=1 Tax=Capsulimonas corticalis TaxID=2219043 RepID=A0A402CS18_9BACT|nr:ABC transporter ATP-binding protein [Capsulimonas corticalis]BDI28246.1 SAV1866 family putative multidrug efflux ABC transporter [Capsulimonas corticalis]